MPIKIDEFRNVRAYKSCGAALFKNEKPNNKPVSCKGSNIIKNGKFHPIHLVTLKLIEKANSILNNHPIICKKILAISEKILRNADCLK